MSLDLNLAALPPIFPLPHLAPVPFATCLLIHHCHNLQKLSPRYLTSVWLMVDPALVVLSRCHRVLISGVVSILYSPCLSSASGPGAHVLQLVEDLIAHFYVNIGNRLREQMSLALDLDGRFQGQA
jgi:hypothetical protein